MKCFTWHMGELTDGIEVDTNNIITLGGDGRHRKKVRLFPKNPAIIGNGVIYEAHPVKYTAEYAGEDFYMLAKPDNAGDKRSLVRILTKWISIRSTMGQWEVLVGSPKDLVIGYGFRGMTRAIGCWSDGIVMMSPGDVVKIIPEGDYKIQTYALFYDKDSVQTMPFNDYIATVNVDFDKCQKL